MWVIRAYDRESDELMLEHELRRVTLRGLEASLGFAPTKFGSTPLKPQQIKYLVPAAKWRGPFEYFLDFDANPKPVRSAKKPRVAATA
jgi:hypothetical protein